MTCPCTSMQDTCSSDFVVTATEDSGFDSHMQAASQLLWPNTTAPSVQRSNMSELMSNEAQLGLFADVLGIVFGTQVLRNAVPAAVSHSVCQALST